MQRVSKILHSALLLILRAAAWVFPGWVAGSARGGVLGSAASTQILAQITVNFFHFHASWHGSVTGNEYDFEGRGQNELRLSPDRFSKTTSINKIRKADFSDSAIDIRHSITHKLQFNNFTTISVL